VYIKSNVVWDPIKLTLVLKFSWKLEWLFGLWYNKRCGKRRRNTVLWQWCCCVKIIPQISAEWKSPSYIYGDEILWRCPYTKRLHFIIEVVKIWFCIRAVGIPLTGDWLSCAREAVVESPCSQQSVMYLFYKLRVHEDILMWLGT
jgi:hypothetical protein